MGFIKKNRLDLGGILVLLLFGVLMHLPMPCDLTIFNDSHQVSVTRQLWMDSLDQFSIFFFESQIKWKWYVELWFSLSPSHHCKILHMPQQHSCCGKCKNLQWSSWCIVKIKWEQTGIVTGYEFIIDQSVLIWICIHIGTRNKGL